MRHIYAFSLLVYASGIQAQVLQVDSVEELKLAQPVERVTLAPSGDYLLLSDYTYSGLTKVDLSTHRTEVITRADGAGYRTQILANGDILFREVTKDPLKRTAIKRFSAATGTTATVVPASRDLVQTDNVLESDHIITGTDFQLKLTTGGKTRTLSPLGTDKRYIWPSISPDGRHLLFFVSAQEAYISDLDGRNAKPIGILRAPKWVDSHTVIGHRDHDNGYVTTSSVLIAKDIETGEEQALTRKDVIALYPSVSEKGDKVLFSTPEGKAYLMHIHVKP